MSKKTNFLPFLVFLSVSFISITGCGYTTSSTLPRSIKTIHVEAFANDITFTTEQGRNVYLPLLEVDARNAVIDRYLFDGNLKIAEPEEADLILKGQLKNYSRSGLRFTDDDDVQEYRVTITVDFELWNTKYEEVSWHEPNFSGEAEYFVTGSQATSETDAIKEAINDLARRIVERTIEDW